MVMDLTDQNKLRSNLHRVIHTAPPYYGYLAI